MNDSREIKINISNMEEKLKNFKFGQGSVIICEDDESFEKLTKFHNETPRPEPPND